MFSENIDNKLSIEYFFIFLANSKKYEKNRQKCKYLVPFAHCWESLREDISTMKAPFCALFVAWTERLTLLRRRMLSL